MPQRKPDAISRLVGAVLLGLCAALPAASALAEIGVSKAEYAAGVLVVRGTTSRPHQDVTIDGRYGKKADAKGRFIFRIGYLPKNCTVELRAGQHTRTADVANCETLRRR